MPFLAVVGVLLSGCSGDSGDDPTTLPSLSATPFATASPVPIPPAAREKTPQGADAFVRFFFKQLNLAFSASDASLLTGLSNDECMACTNYEKAMVAARDNDHYLVGDSFTVSDAAAAPLQELGTRVEVIGSLPERKLVDGRGRPLSTYPARGRFHFTVTVKWNTGGWLVSAIAGEAK